MASGTGSTTIDFGAAPGTNVVTSTSITATGLTSAGYAEAFLQAEASPDHNAYEHLTIFPGEVALVCTPGTDAFTITASSKLRLTGEIAVRYVWST